MGARRVVSSGGSLPGPLLHKRVEEREKNGGAVHGRKARCHFALSSTRERRRRAVRGVLGGEMGRKAAADRHQIVAKERLTIIGNGQ